MFTPNIMRKFYLLILISFLNINAHNQVIEGKVFDQQTKNTVEFASVYFSGTFVGTTTDQNGNFELDVTKFASRALTISAIGYYSATLTDFSSGETFLVYLKPKSYDIDEISVSGKSLAKKRKANIKLFRNEFLGRSLNAMQCKILNEEDITFNYHSDEDTVKAYALKPIIIHNKALGYVVTCYLDKFEYYKDLKITFFEGETRFNEDLNSEESKHKSYVNKRKTAYYGSCMHFFRALWANELRSTEFILRNSVYETLKYKYIVVEGENNKKYLNYYEDINIHYDTEWSKITFLKKLVYFEETGFFDPKGILWNGEMAKERMGDWLPYEYSVDN